MAKSKDSGLALIQDEKAGGVALFDKRRYDATLLVVEKINGLFCDLSGLLARYGYKVDEDLLRRTYRLGAKVFSAIVEEKFDQWAKASDYPAFLVANGKREALASVPEDLKDDARDLLDQIREEARAMPQTFTDADLVFDRDRGALQLGKPFAEKLRVACTEESSAEEVADAKRLCELLAELREIDAKGYTVYLLVQMFIGNRYGDPADLPLLDLDSVLPALRRYPIRVLSKAEAEARGVGHLALLKNLTDNSFLASFSGYCNNMIPQPFRPQPEATPEGGQPGQFAGVVAGLRDLGLEV